MTLTHYPQLKAVWGGHGKDGRKVKVQIRYTQPIQHFATEMNILGRLKRARDRMEGREPVVKVLGLLGQPEVIHVTNG